MKKTHKERRMKMREYFYVAGYSFDPKDLFKDIAIAAVVLTVVAYGGTIVALLNDDITFTYAGYLGAIFLIIGCPLAILATTLFFYVYTDLRIASRKNAIEKVLPEFLQLTAANIRAGLPLDQALWSSIRPQFGILAKEIESVAKETMVGKELKDALQDFANKYDSKMLRRSISLLNEGLDAGSEIGDLLENIALNIQDIQIRKESMAANVTSYTIFISVAVLFAAPMLFAVSMQMLRIVHALSGSLEGSGAAGIAISLSTDAVRESDFFIFCIVSLIFTSVMSTIIIAAIQSGHPRDAIKSMPLFIGVTITIFVVVQWLLGWLFAGLF